MIPLNNANFLESLSIIYNIDKKYIALKQGNWYNPQSIDAKPKTWIGYRILRNEPITLPYYREDIFIEEIDDEEIEVTKNCIEETKHAEIDIQFIGERSEELANNFGFWMKRQIVKDELEKYSGQLMATDWTAWSSDYVLDGNNTITAWNVKLNIMWVHQEVTDQIILDSISIGGNING